MKFFSTYTSKPPHVHCEQICHKLGFKVSAEGPTWVWLEVKVIEGIAVVMITITTTPCRCCGTHLWTKGGGGKCLLILVPVRKLTLSFHFYPMLLKYALMCCIILLQWLFFKWYNHQVFSKSPHVARSVESPPSLPILFRFILCRSKLCRCVYFAREYNRYCLLGQKWCHAVKNRQWRYSQRTPNTGIPFPEGTVFHETVLDQV